MEFKDKKYIVKTDIENCFPSMYTHSLPWALVGKGIAKKRAIELQNLVAHCKYNTYAIDITPQQMEGFDFVISTLQAGNEILNPLAKRAEELGSTLCIISPSYDFARNKVCKALVEAHPCTSIDNRGYLLLFNNHLPKQVFEL